MKTHNLISTFVLMACGMTTTAGVPKHQRELAFVLNRSPDIHRGEVLYETCAACHGEKGEGVSDGSVPVIAGQHFTVVAKQIVDFRHDARRDLRMQHFADSSHLSLSQQIADVALYISRLDPTPPGLTRPSDSEGASIYASVCARCHGGKGEGKADWLVPRIAGQHALYLLQQLTDTVAGHRPDMARAHAEMNPQPDRSARESAARYIASVSP